MIRIKLKKHYSLKLRKHLKNKARIRKKVMGSSIKPRLNVFRSTKHIYAQCIDDVSEKTLASYSSLLIKEKSKGSIDISKQVGEKIAKKILDKKITEVVFDRGGFIYHGRIKALADGARQAGLKF